MELYHAANCRRTSPVSPCDTAGIDEPFALIFVDFVFVSMTGNKNIDIQLPLHLHYHEYHLNISFLISSTTR